jgi:hypothetical protein
MRDLQEICTRKSATSILRQVWGYAGIRGDYATSRREVAVTAQRFQPGIQSQMCA